MKCAPHRHNLDLYDYQKSWFAKCTSIFNLHAHAHLQTHTHIIHRNSKTYSDTIHLPLTFSVYISPNYLHTDISRLQYQTQKKASFMDIHGYGYFQKKLWILQDGPQISKKHL